MGSFGAFLTRNKADQKFGLRTHIFSAPAEEVSIRASRRLPELWRVLRASSRCRLGTGDSSYQRVERAAQYRLH